jgi:hypothetical protein
MSFKDGRIGVGKDPIFPLDISGSCRIDGDLILGGRFSDSTGNPIQLGSGSGATSIPDQTSSSLPSWQGGTITTQGLGVFKGHLHYTNRNILITANNAWNASTTGLSNTSCGYASGLNITSGNQNTLMGDIAGMSINTGAQNTFLGYKSGYNVTNCQQNVVIGSEAMSQYNLSYCTFVGFEAGRYAMYDNNMGIGYQSLRYTNKGWNTAIGSYALEGKVSYQGIEESIGIGWQAGRYQGASIGNIWIGYRAGPSSGSNTGTAGTGNYNIAIGYRSLWNITSGYYNTCIGYDTGRNLNSGGNNVCIGYNCGTNITNHYNTLIGASAGVGMTTASYNTVIGYEAYLCSGLPGSRTGNVFVGYQSGYRPHCDNNVAVGYRSLYNKKAYVCTAIGYQCMGSDSPDSDHVGYNTGVGYNVLRNVEGSSANQGCYNTVMGHAACQTLTTGYKNVVIGGYAGYLNTHLNASVLIGYNAGYNITNVTACTMVGYQAGKSLTTGSQNTLIGYQAGHNITGGTYNCAMGYNAMWNGAGSYNVAIGDQTLASGANTAKNYNIAIGYQALYMATHGLNVAIGYHAGMDMAQGQSNVFIGYQAGKKCNSGGGNVCIGADCMGDQPSNTNVSAGNCVAIGRYALQYTTSGSNSIGIGYQAGKNCLTAQHNTLVGYNSGYSITTGGSNTCFGNHAGSAISTGTHNIAIGNYAGGGGTCTGNYNTTIGHYAGYSFTSGHNNVGVGVNTNRMCTTGQYNMSFGNYAGRSITTGTHNTMIGPQAGYTCNTGYHNVCVGYNADYYNTTGAYNVAIGYHAGTNSGGSTGHNYKLYINSHGGYYDDNCFIYGHMKMDDNPFIRFNGKVAIGTSSPKFPLDVDKSNTSTDMTYWNRGQNDGAYFAAQNESGLSGTTYGQSEIGDLDSGTTYPDGSIGNFNIAAHFKEGIYISDGALYVSSDRRIKTNIVDVKDNLALEVVRNIPCRYYNYKDKLSRGTNATIGFIAQEVKEIYPMAVAERTQFIPNVMRNLNDLRWNNNILFTDLSDCSGITYRFYVSNDENEIRKDIIGNSDNSFTFDTSYNKVFCYGKEVLDFNTLDKSKLFSLNFSATQELDRKVTALETVGNQDHNVKILDLYKENERLKARLEKLEAFLGI